MRKDWQDLDKIGNELRTRKCQFLFSSNDSTYDVILLTDAVWPMSICVGVSQSYIISSSESVTHSLFRVARFAVNSQRNFSRQIYSISNQREPELEKIITTGTAAFSRIKLQLFFPSFPGRIRVRTGPLCPQIKTTHPLIRVFVVSSQVVA